jgi:hypothetical protein
VPSASNHCGDTAGLGEGTRGLLRRCGCAKRMDRTQESGLTAFTGYAHDIFYHPASGENIWLGHMSAHAKAWVVLVLLAAATLGSIWLVDPLFYTAAITLLCVSVLGMLRHKPWALTTTIVLTSLTLARGRVRCKHALRPARPLRLGV